MMDSNDKRLILRYLIWCYKTTKEDIDRIDRYFTQSTVDDFIFEELVSTDEFQSSSGNEEFKTLVQEFEDYKIEKLIKAKKQKYIDTESEELHPKYLYLQRRLSAIEKSIENIFSTKELKSIIDLYEKEMTNRILSARDH